MWCVCCWCTTCCCCCICPLLFPFSGDPLAGPFPLVGGFADVFVLGDCCGTEAGCGLTEAAGAWDLGEAADAANLSDFLPRKLWKIQTKSLVN